MLLPNYSIKIIVGNTICFFRIFNIEVGKMNVPGLICPQQNSDRINAVKTRPGYATRREAIQQHQERTYRNEPKTVTFKQSSPPETCCNCGGAYPHLKPRICPAKGKTCSFCGKLNHFAEVCRQKAQQSLSPNPLSSINRLQTEPFDEVYEPLFA